MLNELLCDKDGVPELVQGLKYLGSSMEFEATFFNGKKCRFVSEWVCPSMGLMQLKPTRMQWLEAENNIIKFAEPNWHEFA